MAEVMVPEIQRLPSSVIDKSWMLPPPPVEVKPELCLEDFQRFEGSCLVRAARAKASSASKSFKDWARICRRLVCMNERIGVLELKETLNEEEMQYIFRVERAYPSGYRTTTYKSLSDAVKYLGLTGAFADASLGANVARGCANDGRYVARFKLKQEHMNPPWHTVCLVKQGTNVSIVDTLIQEKLEEQGLLSRSPEYFFTLGEYEELCRESKIPIDFGCEVFGKLTSCQLYACAGAAK
eukprot:TRINITY_DN94861_c0_g1_i1.p1 TRINITY_DN94861_c0_g1~~TRINITY_DN94861_c0_g1_i1.p1  ORF type:complete len:248 (-),score=46.94 TRINITY_DN94861_c0_g1_i1:21-737(-)